MKNTMALNASAAASTAVEADGMRAKVETPSPSVYTAAAGRQDPTTAPGRRPDATRSETAHRIRTGRSCTLHGLNGLLAAMCAAGHPPGEVLAAVAWLAAAGAITLVVVEDRVLIDWVGGAAWC